MKQCFTLLLVLVALALCGCGGAEKPAAVSEAVAEAVTEAVAAPATQTPATTQDVQIQNTVELSLDKTVYEKEEIMEVTLDFGKLDQETAVIVIVPSDRTHDEKVPHNNAEDYEEYRYLADFSELPFYMWAPDREGQFDVRVYADADDGKELACVHFATGSAQPYAPNPS